MLASRSVRSAPVSRAPSRTPSRSVVSRAAAPRPAVARRAAYSTAPAPSHTAPITSADLKDAQETLETQQLAQSIYAATLVPNPKWDNLLALGDSMPAEYKGKYQALIKDIKESRGDTADIEASFKTGEPLPEDVPLSDELNFFSGTFTEEEIQQAYENTIFGASDGVEPSEKFLALGAEANQILDDLEEGKADEEVEDAIAEEENDEDGGAWASAFAESLAAADGLDEHVILSTFQTAEAVRSHTFAPELFENPAVAEGEQIAARAAYWDHKKDGAGSPYAENAFTDSEIAFLIHVAKTGSDFATASSVFERTLKSAAPSQLVIDQYLEFAFTRGKIDEVFKGVEELKSRGLPISAEAYSTAIRAAASKADLSRATAYLNEVKAAGITPTTRMYASLVFAYGKAKQLDKARAILKDMEADGVAADGLVYHALVLAEFKNGKADAWERIKKEMAEKNVAPSPLSQVFIENEQLDATIPKVPKKARTPAQRQNKKSATNANILSAQEAAQLMDVIEEKAFQRKQNLFIREAGNFYSPIAPQYNTVGGAVTQRVHVNRLIVSAYRFPHHHRVTPIGKLLIEGYFLEGTKAAPKLKKGQKLTKLAPKGFNEYDVEGLQTALKSLTDKLNKAGQAGEAIMKIPDVLVSLGEAHGIFSNPALKKEAVQALEEQAAKNPAQADQLKAVAEWAKKHDGSVPKKVNKAAFQGLFDAVIKAGAKAPAAEEPSSGPSAGGADMYTQVLKRVAQTDKKKATYYAHALDGWFKSEKRGYEVDPSSLTVNARK